MRPILTTSRRAALADFLVPTEMNKSKQLVAINVGNGCG